MASEAPYLLYLETALTSNGTATLSYSVPPSEDLSIVEFTFSSTGAFGITNLRNSNGRIYSNTSSAKYIPSAHLALGNTNQQRFYQLVVPLLIRGSEQLIVELIDTSGSANTVKLTLNCSRMLTI